MFIFRKSPIYRWISIPSVMEVQKGLGIAKKNVTSSRMDLEIQNTNKVLFVPFLVSLTS